MVYQIRLLTLYLMLGFTPYSIACDTIPCDGTCAEARIARKAEVDDDLNPSASAVAISHQRADNDEQNYPFPVKKAAETLHLNPQEYIFFNLLFDSFVALNKESGFDQRLQKDYDEVLIGLSKLFYRFMSQAKVLVKAEGEGSEKKGELLIREILHSELTFHPKDGIPSEKFFSTQQQIRKSLYKLKVLCRLDKILRIKGDDPNPISWDQDPPVPVHFLHMAQISEVASLEFTTNNDRNLYNELAAEWYLRYSEMGKRDYEGEDEFSSYIADKLQAALAYIRTGNQGKAAEITDELHQDPNFIPEHYLDSYTYLLYSLDRFGELVQLLNRHGTGSVVLDDYDNLNLLTKIRFRIFGKTLDITQESSDGYMGLMGVPVIQNLLAEIVVSREIKDLGNMSKMLECIRLLFQGDPLLSAWQDGEYLISPFIHFYWCEFNLKELYEGNVKPDDPRFYRTNIRTLGQLTKAARTP